MSRIHSKKGVDILLEAWSELQGRFPEWELSIVGPDQHEYAKKMKLLTKKLNCERVVFRGELTGATKNKFLQESDLFVLPTYNENFGMVVAEALAFEVPVVCSKGAPWQGLEDHNAGWWIDIGVDPLVKALSSAMSLDSDVLQSMGKNGREWMESDFSWDSIALKTIDVYKKILEKKNERK